MKNTSVKNSKEKGDVFIELEDLQINKNNENVNESKQGDFQIDLNYNFGRNVQEDINEEGEKISTKEKFVSFIKKSVKLLVFGPEDEDTGIMGSTPQVVEDDRNMWNFYGIFNKPVLSTCFGLFKEKNLQNCFGKKKLSNKKQKKGLGTIDGVVIPVILTLFGVILFLRLPMGVGNAGILVTILIFSVGYFASTLTVASICAISTNGTIKGGGAYFMISRILGPEMGGAIGAIFFFANVAGAALYVIGFVDSLFNWIPALTSFFYESEYWSKVIICTIVLVILTIVCVLGADVFSQMGLLNFAVLMVAIFSVILSLLIIQLIKNMFSNAEKYGYTGFSWDTFYENLFPYSEESTPLATTYAAIVKNCSKIINASTVDYDANCSVSLPTNSSFGEFYIDVETGSTLNFQSLFSVLFPACTGAMAGANLSGDLKNPSKSIPIGTFIGLIFTYIIYVALIILIGATIQKDALVSNYSIVTQISLLGIIVTLGIFTATLSSGLTSIIGGSRVLSAIAKDNIFPFLGLFSIEFGWPKKEPRIAVIFTAVLIQCLMFGNSIGFVSMFVTQFFLIAYAMINLACFFLSVAKPPNFRPTYKYFSWWSCLFGFVLCIGIMFFTDWMYATITIFACLLIMFIIFIYMNYRGGKNWGSLLGALIFYISKKFQLQLNNKFDNHLKYWRLKLLVLVPNPKSHFKLIRLFDEMSSVKGGLSIVGMVKTGEFRENLESYTKDRDAWYDLIKEAKFSSFFEITFSQTIRRGIQNLLLHAGFSGMNPDICCIGMFEYKHFVEFDEAKEHKKSGKKIKAIKEFSYKKEKEGFDDDEMSISMYMDVLTDILLFKRGLIIAKGFRNIKKQISKKMMDRLTSKNLFYFDIWILLPSKEEEIEEMSECEKSTSLIFQLANLLQNAHGWKKHHQLRVMILVDRKRSEGDEKKIIKQFKNLLDKIRINAVIKIIELAKEINEMIRFARSKETEEEGRRNRYGEDAEKVIGKYIDENDHEKKYAWFRSVSQENVSEMEPEKKKSEFQLDLEKKDKKKKNVFSFKEREMSRDNVMLNTNHFSQASQQRFRTFNDLNALREQKSGVEFKKKSETILKFNPETSEVSVPLQKSPTENTLNADDTSKFIRSKTENMLAMKAQEIKLTIGDHELTGIEEAEILNKIIKSHSRKTSLIFITLPQPPEEFDNVKNQIKYFHELNTLTTGLKPTFLVYSKINVITTEV